jgi:hypothetical protein
LVLVEPRRASLNGAWNRSACVVVVTVTCGFVPVRPVVSTVSSGTSCAALLPPKLTVRLLPLPKTPTLSRFDSPSSAASTAVLTIGNASGPVVSPSNVSVNVPPVVPVKASVWISLVFWSLIGGLLFVPTAVAGVSSPVTSQRFPSLSKSMSPATWQHAPRSTSTFMIFCSLARSIVGLGPSTNLKRESWK